MNLSIPFHSLPSQELPPRRQRQPWSSHYFLLVLVIFSLSLRSPSRQKPHIAYLLRHPMDSSVTYFNIVRGIMNQRPRQPVPSTLLALKSAPGGLIRTYISHSIRVSISLPGGIFSAYRTHLQQMFWAH